MDNNKTPQDLKNRKEESLRESTNNPMVKNPNPVEKNGKTFKSYSEYLQSDEYKEFLKAEEESQELYTQKAKEYFESFETDNQLLLFFHITNQIFEHYFHGSGSYRSLLYDKFKFGPEAYSLGCSSGMFNVHNAISTPDETEERFQKLINYLNLNPNKEEMMSLRNIYQYGFDNSKQLYEIMAKQQKFDFEKE
jgi:hypothetical protein